jgi:hypothetical protein
MTVKAFCCIKRAYMPTSVFSFLILVFQFLTASADNYGSTTTAGKSPSELQGDSLAKAIV